MPTKGRILYIEDHDDTRELVRLVLEGNDYSVTCDRTVSSALNAARTHHFDLVLLDNWLVDGTGIEFCQRLREFDPLTPVLFYSGAAYDSDKLTAIRAGAHGYLVKPCSFSELLGTVAALLERGPAHLSRIGAAQDADAGSFRPSQT
jgi:DNA-binding response OmpR family regulator